jgi:uncharacterized protein (DUF58 family)
MARRSKSWLRVARPDIDGRLRVGGRRIYVLPTRYGVVFAVLLVLMLIGAVNYGNNPAYLLTFLLAGLGANAIFQTWRNLEGVAVEALPAAPVFAGQPARFRFRVTAGERRERPALQLGFPSGMPEVQDLAAGDGALFELALPTQRRGRLDAERLVISTRYPLGLLRAWCYLETGTACVVYPRPSPPWQPPGQPDYSGTERGDRGVGADDFVGLRGYRLGDSPGHIDWRALAREQGLLTKQFGGDRSEQLWFDWEATPAHDPEMRLGLLARALLDAERGGAWYGLRIGRLSLRPDRGPAHLAACLGALALYPEGT